MVRTGAEFSQVGSLLFLRSAAAAALVRQAELGCGLSGMEEMASLSSFIPRVLCQVPRAAQTAAESLQKAELEPAFISVGITEVSWQWNASPCSVLPVD